MRSSSMARMQAPTAAIGRTSHIVAYDPFPLAHPPLLRPDRFLQVRSPEMPGHTQRRGAVTRWMLTTNLQRRGVETQGRGAVIHSMTSPPTAALPSYHSEYQHSAALTSSIVTVGFTIVI